jgi:putative transposase
MVLTFAGLNRSTYYNKLARKGFSKITGGGRPIPGYSLDLNHNQVTDEQIEAWILYLIDTDPDAYYYGYLKLSHALRRQFKLVINKKKVYRLCKKLGILLPQRITKPKFPCRIAKNRVITGSNQLWEADIKYVNIHGEKRFIMLLCIMDVADRNLVDYHIGLRCTGQDAAIVLKTALLRRQLFNSDVKPVIRTDNGPQFISDYFEKTCCDLSIEHERIPVRTPNKNAHIESFNRLLEDNCLRFHEFDTYLDAYEVIGDYIKRYNNTRLHSAIGYMPPKDFYDKLKSGEISIKMRI